MGEVIALVGLVFTIVTTVAGAVWFLSRAISGLARDNEKSFDKVHTEVKSVSTRLTILERDNYTKPEAEAHALRLALNNPHLKVPDPRNPDRLLHVREIVKEIDP